MSRYGKETVNQLLLLQEADMGSKGTGNPDESDTFCQIRQLLEQLEQENACLRISDLAVNGQDLLALGFAPGPQLGKCLNRLLEQVVEETLPNEKSALLQKARELLP